MMTAWLILWSLFGWWYAVHRSEKKRVEGYRLALRHVSEMGASVNSFHAAKQLRKELREDGLPAD